MVCAEHESTVCTTKSAGGLSLYFARNIHMLLYMYILCSLYSCRHHLTGHIDNHQQELDSLPNFLSNQLSVDPNILTQVLTPPYISECIYLCTDLCYSSLVLVTHLFLTMMQSILRYVNFVLHISKCACTCTYYIPTAYFGDSVRGG